MWLFEILEPHMNLTINNDALGVAMVQKNHALIFLILFPKISMMNISYVIDGGMDKDIMKMIKDNCEYNRDYVVGTIDKHKNEL